MIILRDILLSHLFSNDNSSRCYDVGLNFRIALFIESYIVHRGGNKIHRRFLW